MYADAAPDSEAATLVRLPAHVQYTCTPRPLSSLRASLDAPRTHGAWYAALAASMTVAALPWLLLAAPPREGFATLREAPRSYAPAAGDDDAAPARAEPRPSPAPRLANARRRDPPPVDVDEAAGAPVPDLADILEAPLRP